LDFQEAHIELEKSSFADSRYAKIIVGPLERGYGTTLGNSLRRVLLSSLAGTAISNIKIDGVLHEFSSIKGVKEDVIEIIANLKKLAIKNHTDRHDLRTAYLEVTGEREVLARDIQVDSDLEIMNPDLHIASLSSSDSKLIIELIITDGRGYSSSEKNKSLSDGLGMIAIDSIYTPVERVNFSVQDMRVGNITDYDKLILEIWTDNTLTAIQALKESSRIIKNSFDIFETLDDDLESYIIQAQEQEEKDGMPVAKDKEIDLEKLAKKPIEELDLSVRSYNCLKRAGMELIADLLDKTEEDMQKVRNLGHKSYQEVMAKLESMGLSLRAMDQED
jgi:DNA-directed RNA polymerase subunit alpha